MKKIKFDLILFLPALIFFGGLKDERLFFIFALFFSFLFLRSGTSLKVGPWLYFWIWTVFSSFFSLNPAISFFGSFKFFIFYAIYCYFVENREKIKPYFASFIAIAGAVFAFYCAFGGLFLSIRTPWTILGLNPNYSAAFFSICTLYFYQKSLTADSFSEKIREISVYACFFLASLLFNSRGAFLGLSLGIIYISYFTKGKKTALYSAGTLIAVFMFLAYKNDLLKLSEMKSYARPYIWLTALKASFHYPIWGAGSGMFGEVFEKFKFPYFTDGFYYAHSSAHAHSEIFQVLAEFGIPGLAIFFWGLNRSFFTGFNRGGIYKAMALCLMIHGLFDVIFYLPVFWIFLFAFFALSQEEKQSEQHPAPTFFAKLFFAFSFFAALGFFYFRPQLNISASTQKEIDITGVNAFKSAAYCEIFSEKYPKNWLFPYVSYKFYSLTGLKEKAAENAAKAYSLEPLAFEKSEKNSFYGR
ncbi:MAG: O-antigen ligase family protein [Elusimicrobiota bacterium]